MSMRPIYENVRTLRDEDAVAETLAAAWRCEHYKLPRSYHVDRWLERDGRLVCWLEIKCRNQRYDTFFISLQKVLSARSMARETYAPFVIAVSLPDGIFWMKDAGETLDVRRGGRSDRGDPADMEPMVHFAMSRFTLLRT